MRVVGDGEELPVLDGAKVRDEFDVAGDFTDDFAGFGGEVEGGVVLHADDAVGDGEVGAAAADDDDGGDFAFVVEGADFGDEGDDGVVGVEAGHAVVANEEVGGAGVFVEEEEFGADFEGFLDGGGEGGGAGGVFGGEGLGCHFDGAVGGEGGDEGGDVDVGDGAAVFGTDFDGGGVGHDELAAIARDEVVDSVLDGFEEGGFAVEATAGDDGYAEWDAHAENGTGVGGGDGDFVFWWGFEWNGFGVGEGLFGYAGGTREDGAVGDEGDEAVLFEGVAEVFLGFDGADEFFEVVEGEVFKDVLNDGRDLVAEHEGSTVAEDVTASSGKTDEEAELDFHVFGNYTA